MMSLESVKMEQMSNKYNNVHTLRLFGSSMKVDKGSRDCACLTWFVKEQKATDMKAYNTTILINKEEMDKKLAATEISELLKASCVDTKHAFLVIFNK